MSFFKGVAKTLSNAVKNWSGYEKIAAKLENIPKEAYENIYKSYIPQEGGFNVVNHGDMFLNNILFRYDHSGKPIDIRFVSNVPHIFDRIAIFFLNNINSRWIFHWVNMQVHQTI